MHTKIISFKYRLLSIIDYRMQCHCIEYLKCKVYNHIITTRISNRLIREMTQHQTEWLAKNNVSTLLTLVWRCYDKLLHFQSVAESAKNPKLVKRGRFLSFKYHVLKACAQPTANVFNAIPFLTICLSAVLTLQHAHVLWSYKRWQGFGKKDNTAIRSERVFKDSSGCDNVIIKTLCSIF